MSWHDCINPFGLPNHSHDFTTETNHSVMLYANKICPMCWHKALTRNDPIVTMYGNPATFKQAGSDTL